MNKKTIVDQGTLIYGIKKINEKNNYLRIWAKEAFCQVFRE